MRKLLFGLVGLAALGFGAIAAPPAEAQPYFPGYGAYQARPAFAPVQYRRPYVGYAPVQYRRPYRAYRPYGGGYRPYRPYGYHPAYVGRRCFVRPQRVWTNYGWVSRPVRVCR
jgi:hypothetical protein